LNFDPDCESKNQIDTIGWVQLSGAYLDAKVGQFSMQMYTQRSRVTKRGQEFSNGDKLSNWRILRYSDAYELYTAVSDFQVNIFNANAKHSH
jgi:hypothetical protein